MRVYLVRPDVEAFQWLMPIDRQDLETISSFSRPGEKVSTGPIRLTTVAETRDRPSGDFPNVAPLVPVFSSRAVRELQNLLPPARELLPLEHDGCPYYGLRVPALAGALDLENSGLVRFEGRIMRIDRFVFHADKIGERMLFTIPEKRTALFAQEPFVTAMSQAGLIGFETQLVWQV